jgi:hypothetical protein
VNLLCKSVALCMLAACVVLPRVADAYSYIMMSDAELFDGAEGVVKARIERVRPAADGDTETHYEIRVLEVLSGPALEPHQTLVLPGSFDAPNANFIVQGVPRLKEGGTVLLFHARRSDGDLLPMQLSLGLFGLVATEQGPLYVRDLESSREFEKRRATQRFHAARDALAFERWLRARARGVHLQADYLREKATFDSTAKFTFSAFDFNPAGPGRWFQFDAGQTLPWTARPGGQSNTTFDEFLSLQQGLAAWTNDAGSRIALSYSGTAASSPTCNQSNDPGCFTGHVIWNDPNNVIGGSYSCGQGGTLAIGGSLAFSNGQAFNGQTWYPRARAQITIQDGAGCAMDDNQGADGAELLTHEIGHTLAFGHSCDDDTGSPCGSNPVLNEATMRPFIHGDGRGAVLGVDDRAGAAIAYPQPGSDVTPPSVPTNLVANTSGTTANLTWGGSSDAGSGVAGYELERCRGAGCNNFAQIVSQAATTFPDANLAQMTTFRYRVRAFDVAGNRSGYSNIATTTTNAATVTPLSNAVAVPGLSGSAGSERHFSLSVPANATNLSFTLSGGDPDADLYVRFGATPTSSINDCASADPSNNENCSFATPAAGTYFVLVLGFDAYSAANLVGSYQLPNATNCASPCIFRSGFE